MGGHGHVAKIVAAVESTLAHHGVTVDGLWFFATAESYRARLQRRGFVRAISLFERPTALPGDISGWLETFLQSQLLALPTMVRPMVVSAIVDELRPKLCDSSGRWSADYVRLRFRADKLT